MFNWWKKTRFQSKVYRSLRDDYRLTHADASAIVMNYAWLIDAFEPDDSPHGIATFVLSKMIKEAREGANA